MTKVQLLHVFFISLHGCFWMMSSGCSDGLDPAFRVIDNRVLGAKMTVVGDETRATASFEDQIEVELIMANAAEALAVTWMMVVCIPVPTQFGISVCAGDPLYLQTQSESSTENPKLNWTIPPEQFLGGVDELLILGAVCEGGSPSIDMEEVSFSCGEDNNKQTLFTSTIPLLVDDQEPNQHPEIASVQLGFNNWVGDVPKDFQSEGCGTFEYQSVLAQRSPFFELPLIMRGEGSVPIAVIPTDDSREEYATQVFDEIGQSVEDLQIDHFCTAGELSNQYEVIDDLWDTEDRGIQWKPPVNDEIPMGGLLVRFNFIVRDKRGGVDFESHSLCLLPEQDE